MRSDSLRDICLSLARITLPGAFAEALWRRRRGAAQTFAYDLPVESLTARQQLIFTFRRLSWQPAWIASVSLHATPNRGDELVGNQHALEGYVHPLSVAPGDPIELSVHAPAGEFSLDIVRYGSAETARVREGRLSGRSQPYPRAAFRLGTCWEPSFRLQVPEGWPSGLYGARMMDPCGGAFTAPFIVRSVARTHPARLVIASTNTWQAYNEWGGASFYHWRGEGALGRNHSSVISLRRPNPAADPDNGKSHLARGLRALVEWLERRGYDYDMATDSDCDADPSLLGRYRTVVLDSHAEYWSSSMLAGLERYVRRSGGALVYLSGNGLYWKTEMRGELLEVRKPSGVHPESRDLGGLWADLGSPAAALIGVAYTPAGANNWAPFRVVSSDHWVFDGTGLRDGDLFGQEGEFGAASGHETDKMSFASPRNTILLARGCNPGGGGADMVYLEHPGGGRVFSAGSVSFVGAVLHDERLARILSNVLDRFAADDLQGAPRYPQIEAARR
jgi:hypothetical protein